MAIRMRHDREFNKNVQKRISYHQQATTGECQVKMPGHNPAIESQCILNENDKKESLQNDLNRK